MNGATALTSCVSSSSTDETSASSRRQEFARAGRPAAGPGRARPSGKSVGLRHRQLRRRPLGAAARTSSAGSNRAAQAFVVAEQRRSSCSAAARRRSLALEHVPIELGRPPNRLARVVDDEVEAVAGRVQMRGRMPRRSACGAGRARRSPAGHPTPRSRPPARNGRSIARETGRDDQMSARPQQLDPGLIADLHPAAGEQCDAARRSAFSVRLREVELAARAGTAGRRTDGCRGSAACRCSSAAARSPRGTRDRRPRPPARIRRAGRRSAS